MSLREPSGLLSYGSAKLEPWRTLSAVSLQSAAWPALASRASVIATLMRERDGMGFLGLWMDRGARGPLATGGRNIHTIDGEVIHQTPARSKRATPAT